MYYLKFEAAKRSPQESCVWVELLPADVAPHISGALVEIPAGGVNNSKTHFDMAQVYFLLEGSGTFVLDSEEFEVEAESVIEVPVGLPHAMRADKGQPIRYLYINDPV